MTKEGYILSSMKLKLSYARYVKNYYRNVSNECEEHCLKCPHEDSCEYSDGPMTYSDFIEENQVQKYEEKRHGE